MIKKLQSFTNKLNNIPLVLSNDFANPSTKQAVKVFLFRFFGKKLAKNFSYYFYV